MVLSFAHPGPQIIQCLIFYLGVQLKIQCITHPYQDYNLRMKNEFKTLSPESIRKVKKQVLLRSEKFVAVQGRQFEHLLKKYFLKNLEFSGDDLCF